MYKIILASGSPRRKELFTQVGIPFQVSISDKEERYTKENPEDIVMELAEIKACDVAKQYGYGTITIGADTLVALGKEVMGKPKNQEDAYGMIEKLQGRWHQVYTGVSLVIKEDCQKKERVVTFYEKTEVKVAAMSGKEISRYIECGEPYDKAGGYGIQGLFGLYVSEIQGDYNTIVGFPLSKLYSVLQLEGISFFEFES